MFKFFVVFALLVVVQTKGQTISGKLVDSSTGEPLSGLFIQISGTSLVYPTNNYGLFSFVLPTEDTLEIVFGGIGYQSKVLKLNSEVDTTLIVTLLSASDPLNTIDVLSFEENNLLFNPVAGVVSIPVSQVRNIPAFQTEKDVLHNLQLLPGVQSGNERNDGLFVRGSTPGQNLILLDGAPVYNAFHLFGPFSTFNSDAIKSLDLYRGSLPTRFGGRLSSVVDIQLKEGGKDRIHGDVSIGTLSAKATINGPIGKRVHYMLSGRRSYMDLPLTLISPTTTKANFGDYVGKLKYDLDSGHSISLSGYTSSDRFGFNFSSGIMETSSFVGWGNKTLTFQSQNLWNSRLYTTATLFYSNYQYLSTIESEQQLEMDKRFYAQETNFQLNNVGGKIDASYILSSNLSLLTGLSFTNYASYPKAYLAENKRLEIRDIQAQKSTGLESGVYGDLHWTPTSWMGLDMGARWSWFKATDKNYGGIEPRLQFGLYWSDITTTKIGIAKTYQFIHHVSSTSLGLLTDLWIPSSNSIPAQMAWQYSIGQAYSMRSLNLMFEVDAYYRSLSNIQGYTEGNAYSIVSIEDNPDAYQIVDWQKNMITGIGESYGLELLIRRLRGKLTGWAGYTLSYTRNQFEEINMGNWFYPNHDRRHEVEITLGYQISKSIRINSNWVRASGRPITLLKYPMFGNVQAQDSGYISYFSNYGSRETYRTVPYHRLDVGVQFSKKKSVGSRTWEVGLYNALSRINPSYYENRWEQLKASESIFYHIGLISIIPSFSYSRSF